MCTYRSVQKMPCWCRFGHTETRTFKETAWCKNWNEVAMSRGADVGGLTPQPANLATTWTLFCTLPRTTLGSSLASWSPSASLSAFSVFVTLFVKSIKVKVSSTYLFYSSSSNDTLLLALAFTTSIKLLLISCPVWGHLFKSGPYPTTVTTLWQKYGL